MNQYTHGLRLSACLMHAYGMHIYGCISGWLIEEFKLTKVLVTIALLLGSSCVAYAQINTCTSHGGTKVCIPPDNPGLSGTYDPLINQANGCYRVDLSGPRNDGVRSYAIQSIQTPSTPYVAPFLTTVNYCGNLPPSTSGYFPRLVLYYAKCRDGYDSLVSADNPSMLCIPKCAPGEIHRKSAVTNIEKCFKVVDVYSDSRKTCPNTSLPIYAATGNETYAQLIYPSFGGYSITFGYDSIHGPWGRQGSIESAPGTEPIYGQLGKLWWNNLDRRLVKSPNNLSLQAVRGHAQIISFNATSPGGLWNASADQRDTLTVTADGGYLYRDQGNLGLEAYSSSGTLQQLVRANGMSLIATQTASSNGHLASLSDPFGRQLLFTYRTLSSGDVAIDTVIDPGAQTIAAGYDSAGNLERLTWPDSTARGFVYDSPQPTQSWAFTGILDENNKRHATIIYDSTGWAKSSEAADGADKYLINYVTPPQPVVREVYDDSAQVLYRYHEWVLPVGTTITQPNDTVIGLVSTSALSASSAQGSPRTAGYSQPGGTGCSASTSNITYDSRGNVDNQDDFNGKRVCHAYESSRNFETIRVEGLDGGTSGSSCTAALSASDVGLLAPEARKISTEWHPDWRLETRRAEPGKITTWIYNGQPDPFNGGAVASCTSPMYGATSVDPLPDGKPIAVLCKQVVQSTTDTTGSQGFAAALQVSDPNNPWSVASRTVSHTYNQYGQVLTSTDERGQVLNYVYYDTTTGTYTKGDLWKVTNALGHVTEYTQYNPHGQVLQAKDPNGVITSYTYDLRQRLTSVTQANQLTQIDWWPTGLLKKVTQPDGSWLSYVYDDAHRMTGISDNLGNAVAYELDNAGNREKEQVKDSSGTLTLQINRNYDALNRLWKTSTGVPF